MKAFAALLLLSACSPKVEEYRPLPAPVVALPDERCLPEGATCFLHNTFTSNSTYGGWGMSIPPMAGEMLWEVGDIINCTAEKPECDVFYWPAAHGRKFLVRQSARKIVGAIGQRQDGLWLATGGGAYLGLFEDPEAARRAVEAEIGK